MKGTSLIVLMGYDEYLFLKHQLRKFDIFSFCCTLAMRDHQCEWKVKSHACPKISSLTLSDCICIISLRDDGKQKKSLKLTHSES